MKRLSGILGTGAVIAITLAGSATNAGAICSQQRRFGTFDTEAAVYTYVYTPPTTTNASMISRYWQSGMRSAGNEGTCDNTRWMVPYGTGKWYIGGTLADACVAGCPDGSMDLVIQDGTKYLLARVGATPPAALWFNYATLGNMTLADISPVHLANRVKASNLVSFDVGFDPIAPGFYGDASAGTATENITSFNLMMQRRPTGNQPPTNAVSDGWTLVAATVPTSAANLPGFQIDCTTPDQVYLAVQLSFDNGELNGDFVGPITRVSCDPTLADPQVPGNFKIIPKGPKSKKNQ